MTRPFGARESVLREDHHSDLRDALDVKDT